MFSRRIGWTGFIRYSYTDKMTKRIHKTVWSAMRYSVNKSIGEDTVPDKATFYAFKLSPENCMVVESGIFLQRPEYDQQELRARESSCDFDGFIRVSDGAAIVPKDGIGMKMLLK